MNRLLDMVAKAYQKNVYKSLRMYGLRYDDIIVAEHPDVQQALKFIPAEEFENRYRRLRRAQHLSLIHEYLPLEVQAVQEPDKPYLQEAMEDARKLREERERMFNF